MTDTLRIDLDPDATGRGLAELVLVVFELVRELLERRAIRRLEEGRLHPQQVEHLGAALRDAALALHAIREAIATPASPNGKD